MAVASAAVTRQGRERSTSQLSDEFSSLNMMNDTVAASLSPPDRLGLIIFFHLVWKTVLAELSSCTSRSRNVTLFIFHRFS